MTERCTEWQCWSEEMAIALKTECVFLKIDEKVGKYLRVLRLLLVVD